MNFKIREDGCLACAPANYSKIFLCLLVCLQLLYYIKYIIFQLVIKINPGLKIRVSVVRFHCAGMHRCCETQDVWERPPLGTIQIRYIPDTWLTLCPVREKCIRPLYKKCIRPLYKFIRPLYKFNLEFLDSLRFLRNYGR